MSSSFAPAFALLALTLGACSEPSPPPFGDRETFVALERHFQGFESWTKIDLSHRAATGETHVSGEAHEYISRTPPAGSKTFPVGTILVKTVKPDAASEQVAPRTDVFAMVKRGGGYNGRGAPGWEWFELRKREDDTYGIVWRGVNPPNGEGYHGDALGGCNGCHRAAAKNDYVQATALVLSKI
jgi:hypothetical protein